MLFFTVSFLLGDMFLLTFTHLPHTWLLIAIIAISFCVWIVIRKYFHFSYLFLAFTLGFAWTAWSVHTQLAWSFPSEWEGKPLYITGYIASLPIQDTFQNNFMFVVKDWQSGETKIHQRAIIHLGWREQHIKLHVGDKWHLLVKLKRIHGTANPGGFDYEAWALQNGLRATGYVVSGDNKWIAHANYFHMIDQLRFMLRQKIQRYSPINPWLYTLLIGERENIPPADWQVLRNTGTNHLMAIGGLHIGIIAGFMHFLVSWCWRRKAAFVLRLPAQHAGVCAALLSAYLYGALSGFAISTQRACLMLTVLIIGILSRRKLSAWHAWSVAMLCVLIFNPLDTLSESFWLSFATIAMIIYGMSQRLSPSGFWWKWGRVQWVIGIGLVPLSLLFFQQCSLISFVANSIAIPWLAFLILPFCFFALLFILLVPPLAHLFLIIANINLSGLWWILNHLAHLPMVTWQQVLPTHGLFLSTMCAIIILLFPRGMPGRWLGIVWLMPLLLYTPLRPQAGEYWLTLLDVGQGLAVSVQTKQHTLVFDAGAKFNNRVDMGESVVVPYLYFTAVKQLDMLVVSHGDNDHIGGVPAVLAALPVHDVMTSVPEKISFSSVHYCFAGIHWNWDGVDFTFIHPTETLLHLDNDSSCVLRIDNGHHSVLLTGDIEKVAENDLLKRAKEQLKSDILIAPHHGSKTSAVTDFINAVNPHYVLYATGYRNRYHFPNPDVIKAYEDLHAIQLNTVTTGAMTFKLDQQLALNRPFLYRKIHPHLW